MTQPTSRRLVTEDKIQTVNDAAVAANVEDTSTATGAAVLSAVDSHLGGDATGLVATVGNVQTIGYNASASGVSAASSDNTSALSSAVSAAIGAGLPLLLPSGTLAANGDVTFPSELVVQGHAAGTTLQLNGGGVVIDGSTTHAARNTFRDLHIVRTGTAGPALRLKGGGTSTGVIRWTAINVQVESSTGDGLSIEGSYIGSFHGCYFRGCSGTGVVVKTDPVTGVVGGNLISFHGGEIQGNVNGVSLSNTAGIWFFGVGFEGNTSTGVNLAGNVRNVGIFGGYFEGNGGYDIAIGTAATTGNVITVHNAYLADAGIGKTYSILINRGLGIDLDGLNFSGYGSNSPIRVSAVTGQVSGMLGQFTSNGTVPVVSDASRIMRWKSPLTGSAVLDFPSLTTGSSANLTITVAGAAVGDDATVHVNGSPPNGIVYMGWVSAADTVTVRCMNILATTVDPPAATIRVRVWR